MRLMHGALLGSVTAVICLGLLFAVYPWSVYFGNFTYGSGMTLLSYVLLAVLVGIVVASASCIFVLFSRMVAITQGLLTGIVSFALLFSGSLLLGPGGIDIFDTRIGGIFFSEWKFLTFDSCIALPISIFAAALVWWAARRRHDKASQNYLKL